jgi:tRNA-specific 2-thiouridylase
MFYTIGQRQGLGIGGVHGCNDLPWYTLDKNLERNVLIVGQGPQHPLLFTNHLRLSDMNWIGNPTNRNKSIQCMAKTRYRQADQACTLKPQKDARGIVEFESPQRAITPGQSVVFYSGHVCLGGGVIDQTWNSSS